MALAVRPEPPHITPFMCGAAAWPHLAPHQLSVTISQKGLRGIRRSQIFHDLMPLVWNAKRRRHSVFVVQPPAACTCNPGKCQLSCPVRPCPTAQDLPLAMDSHFLCSDIPRCCSGLQDGSRSTETRRPEHPCFETRRQSPTGAAGCACGNTTNLSDPPAANSVSERSATPHSNTSPPGNSTVEW